MREENYSGIAGLVALIKKLRLECQWDRVQTHRSLVQYLVEECYEVVEAIEQGTEEDLREELGDLLLQVVFHADIAGTQGRFTLEDIAQGVIDKMVRRHPEIFSTMKKNYSTVAEHEKQWQQAKYKEKSERAGPFDGLPRALPSLTLALKIIDRAAKLDVPLAQHDTSIVVANEKELGQELFALVQKMHTQGLDPERALRNYLQLF